MHLRKYPFSGVKQEKETVERCRKSSRRAKRRTRKQQSESQGGQREKEKGGLQSQIMWEVQRKCGQVKGH